MKKQPFPILILITLIFAAFTIGLYLGRNLGGSEIRISGASETPAHSGPIATVSTEAAKETVPVTFPININTATAQQLTALPGIGELLAGRIIDYRTANGPYAAPEELLNVEGIGAGKLEAILTLISTGG